MEQRRGLRYLPERDWRPVRLTPDAASRRKLLGVLAEAEPSGPTRLGPSLPAIIGGRTQVRRRVLALVVLDVDDDLVSALLKLRRQGVAVSVVHVAAEDGARGGAKTARGATTTPAPALAAAGARYVRLHRDDDLHTALAATQSRRPVRAG